MAKTVNGCGGLVVIGGEMEHDEAIKVRKDRELSEPMCHLARTDGQ